MHVVLAGLDRLPFDQRPDLVVADLSEDGRARLTDAILPGLEHGPVLVIHPTWDQTVGAVVDSVHAALDRTSVLRHRTSLPPLAAAVLAELAVRLQQHLPDPGALVAGLPHVEDEILAGAVMGSVSRLEHVQASVGQHLASWLPRGRFLATFGQDGVVRRLPRGEQIALPEMAPDHRLFMAVGDTTLDEPVRRGLDGATPRPDDGSWDLDLPSHSTAWWGTADLVEFAVVPRLLQDLAARILDRVGASQACRWCEHPAPVSPCPWCGHVRATAPVKT